MLQQNYEAVERRIALKLFKGIKQLQIPQPDMSLQHHNFIVQKFQTLKLQLQNSLNYVNQKLQKLEDQIKKMKSVIYKNYHKDVLNLPGQKSIKENNLKKNSLSSLNFKSVPILRFNSDDKQEDLLSDLYEQVDQRVDQVSQKQYSFCIAQNQNLNKIYKKDESYYKDLTQTPKKQLNKNNLNKNANKQQFILFDQKKTNKKGKQYQKRQISGIKEYKEFKFFKQFGVNTTSNDHNNIQDNSQVKIGYISKATAAQPQNQNQNIENTFNKNEIQQLKQQIANLKKIIMTTHHIHFSEFEKSFKDQTVNEVSLETNMKKIHKQNYQQPQYQIKIQHYKNQNIDLRNMVKQLKYELKHKQNQIQEYVTLLIRLKQTIKQVKNQVFSQLLPCQYCSFKSYVDLKIEEDQERFGIKNS